MSKIREGDIIGWKVDGTYFASGYWLSKVVCDLRCEWDKRDIDYVIYGGYGVDKIPLKGIILHLKNRKKRKFK